MCQQYTDLKLFSNATVKSLQGRQNAYKGVKCVYAQLTMSMITIGTLVSSAN